jgi:hypothetical protein
MPHERNEIAGVACRLAGMPLVAQRPLDGNSAHSLIASATSECAHEFAGERAEPGASCLSAGLAEPTQPIRQAPWPPAMTSPALQNRSTFPDFESTAGRALAATRVIERISQLCPQAEDCAGPVENQYGCRVYQCDECDFRGCASCMEIHESEPHWSDSATTRERYSL